MEWFRVVNKRGHMSFDRFANSNERKFSRKSKFNFQAVGNFPMYLYKYVCELWVLMYWWHWRWKPSLFSALFYCALLRSINHHRYYFPISFSLHFILSFSYFPIIVTNKSWIFDENRSPRRMSIYARWVRCALKSIQWANWTLVHDEHTPAQRERFE